MDIKKIEKLISLIEKSSINEIEIKEGDTSIRIAGVQSQDAISQIKDQGVTIPKLEEVHEAKVSTDTFQTSEVLEKKYIKSPIVGTFYRSASPASKPFIIEGQNIKLGDALCIIEAMKIMNQIEAETTGKILKIMVENGTAVEYDQPLFMIGE